MYTSGIYVRFFLHILMYTLAPSFCCVLFCRDFHRHMLSGSCSDEMLHLSLVFALCLLTKIILLVWHLIWWRLLFQYKNILYIVVHSSDFYGCLSSTMLNIEIKQIWMIYIWYLWYISFVIAQTLQSKWIK